METYAIPKRPTETCACGKTMRMGRDICGRCRAKLAPKRKRTKLPWWIEKPRPHIGYKKNKPNKPSREDLSFTEANGVVLGNTLPRH